MKKISFLFLAMAMTSFGILSNGISDEDRKMTVDRLTKTQDRLMLAVKFLSEEQINFKASPESWSIAECVEHIAISENVFGEMMQTTLQVPANPVYQDSVVITDDQIWGMITNRDNKMKTSEAFEPSGQFGTFKETVEAFNTKRAEHIELMSTTEADLRNHYGQLPFAVADGVQIVIFWAGHSKRHILQIEEIMAHDNFPKDSYVPK